MKPTPLDCSLPPISNLGGASSFALIVGLGCCLLGLAGDLVRALSVDGLYFMALGLIRGADFGRASGFLDGFGGCSGSSRDVAIDIS